YEIETCLEFRRVLFRSEELKSSWRNKNMVGYRKLGRTSSQRKAMIRSQVTALLYHGKIRTTETRAKEIRKVAEGLIAMGVKEKRSEERRVGKEWRRGGE